MLALFANILSEDTKPEKTNHRSSQSPAPLDTFTPSTNPSCLKKLDFSSCRLNDTGLLYLINALQNNKLVSHLKLIDNFFSEEIEAILLQTLNKNTSLVEICLQRNRLSHS